MNWFLRKIDTVIGAICATAGALVFSQTRAFIDQYIQRLGGHLDEARLVLEQMSQSRIAERLPEEAIQGVRMEASARVAELETALTALRDATAWDLPWVFLNNVDWSIAEAALTDFAPALPIDPAGLAYMGAGLLLGLVLYEVIKLPGSLLIGRLNGSHGHGGRGHARGLRRR